MLEVLRMLFLSPRWVASAGRLSCYHPGTGARAVVPGVMAGTFPGQVCQERWVSPGEIFRWTLALAGALFLAMTGDIEGGGSGTLAAGGLFQR